MLKKAILICAVTSILSGCAFSERVADRIREKPAEAQPTPPVKKNCLARAVDQESKKILDEGSPVVVTDYGDRFSVTYPTKSTWVGFINLTTQQPLMFLTSNNEYLYSADPKKTFMKGLGNKRGTYLIRLKPSKSSIAVIIGVDKCDS